MSSFSVPVIRIPKATRLPNSDSLMICEIFGDPCIFKAGTFQEGDLAIYVPEDAVVPHTVKGTEFLGRNRRIRARRIRGTFSCGLLLPLSCLPHNDLVEDGLVPLDLWGRLEGRDVAADLGIYKWEEPVSIVMGGEDERDPGCMPVYGMESYRKFKHTLIPGENVVITEKLHGCVPPGSKILMADGSYRRIKDIQVGEYVLGRNPDTGAAVSSKVLAIHNNGETDDWLEIKTACIGAGKGPSHRVFVCTPNHEVFANGKWVEASTLVEGDEVLVANSRQRLDPLQEEVLTGMILGDASINQNVDCKRIEWGHRLDHEEYMDWIQRALGPLVHPRRNRRISGFGTSMVAMSTVNSDLVAQVAKKFIDPVAKRKIIPPNIKLSPISVAFWYMDDGSLSHHSDQLDRASFAVCSFTRQECEYLIEGLARLGIEAVYYEAEGYSRLRLNAEAAERLFLLTAPYISKCMQYKLPERFRGVAPWLPSLQWSPNLVSQKIIGVSKRKELKARHDLTTETGNYLSGGVLIHNSNFRSAWYNGQFYVGSHRRFKREDSKNLFWRAARQIKLEEKLKSLRPNIALYGEVYGQVQDLRYGARPGQVWLRFFDAYDIEKRRFLDWPSLQELAEIAGIDLVPVVYRGPFDAEVVEQLAGGPSVLGHNNREGIVIKPEVERINPHTGRTILKLVSEWYRTRKNGTEHH